MPTLDVRVSRKSDTIPQFDYLNETNTTVVELKAMGILEGGMKSGAASVALIAQVPGEEKYFLIQTSAAIIKAAAAGVQGAEERFATPDPNLDLKNKFEI